jgi:hypothetical protein
MPGGHLQPDQSEQLNGWMAMSVNSNQSVRNRCHGNVHGGTTGIKVIRLFLPVWGAWRRNDHASVNRSGL